MEGGGDGGGFDEGESIFVFLGSEDGGGSLKSLVWIITDYWSVTGKTPFITIIKIFTR